MLVSGVPQEVYAIWLGNVHNIIDLNQILIYVNLLIAYRSRYPYVFGEVFCVVRGLMAETAANATVLTLSLIHI